jgi:protein SCO1
MRVDLMNSVKTLRLLLLLLAAVCLVSARGAAFPGGLQAENTAQRNDRAQAVESKLPSGPTKVSIPDATVLDQNGRKLRFYTDLVKDKTIAINFIFTTCTTICPPMTANFARVQKTMMAHGQKDFYLISVSVDPENDTPAKLKAYAEMFQAKPGWTFVTGTRAELQPIWQAFSVYSGGAKQDHAPTVVIGNDARHSWTYASGLTSASKLVTVIEPFLESRSAAKTPAPGTKENRGVADAAIGSPRQ